RSDMAAKSTGTAQFACDVRLPDMVFASIRRNPVPGGGIKRFDAKAALAFPGALQVVPLENGFAAVAQTTLAAIQALDMVEVEWEVAATSVDDALIEADLRAALLAAPDSAPRAIGEIGATEFE